MHALLDSLQSKDASLPICRFYVIPFFATAPVNCLRTCFSELTFLSSTALRVARLQSEQSGSTVLAGSEAVNAAQSCLLQC